ncbi:MAG: serine/threonine protein kinase [Thiohalocapsa sp.]|jgi:serine/threonine protein kinase|uniref:serine/threonine protein kinase n=1 Tax=Thiohalocapsa sp. TaxID=2497641 RepID=UPI0025F41C3A|nr:serine/threonine-protein kinase [Thiohalocapsa sp.]MCG6941904.1 serine/threonine protein kinase [Thiohalocapsa sp.]
MARARDSLEPGTMLDCYRIVDTIGKGGFSLIYLAEDEETGDEVVIKEFMPKRLARRHDDGRLVPVDSKQRESLYRSRRLFFQEAKVMASLQHPHIVAVLNMFMRNDTGYIVMQHERGRNLGQFVHDRGGELSTTLLMRIFIPLLDALNTMHARAMLHLDVKPGNIHLRNGHDPLLLDLGAAQVLTVGGSTASHVITAGYSPPEQYRHGGKIGPWTDVYAVGASLRCCMEGRTPQPAPDRLTEDKVVPAAEQFADLYPHWLLEITDRSMLLNPNQRPRDAGEMLEIMQRNAHPGMRVA